MAEEGLCWRILGSKKILMSIKDLDNCEISTKNAITATPPPPPLLPPTAQGIGRDQRLPTSFTQGASAKQEGDFPFVIWRCILLFPLQGHNIFVVTLIDPSLLDYIVFHWHSSTYSTDKFHDSHIIQTCLWRFYVLPPSVRKIFWWLL